MHTGTNWTISPAEKVVQSVVPFSSENASSIVYDANIESKSKHSRKKHNWTKHQTVKLHEQRQISVINPDSINVRALENYAHSGRSLINLNNKNPNSSYSKIISSTRVFNNVLLNSGREHCLYTEISPNVQNLNEKQPSEDRKPSETQLQNVFDVLREDVCIFAIQRN